MAEVSLADRTAMAMALSALCLVSEIATAAKECEWAQRLREYEVEVFAYKSPTGSGADSESHRGCVLWRSTYWTYEVCPGRWIREFHKMGDVIVDENFLGIQHQWNLVDEVGSRQLKYRDGVYTIPERLNASGVALYSGEKAYTCSRGNVLVSKMQVDVAYPNGTACGWGYRRSANLHFVCNENKKKPRVDMREIAMCTYDITVEASTVCDAIYGRSRAYKELSDSDMVFAL
uniref:Uncharacterized protein TCIL3000_9_3540 n=1 Tax=Trypanosoma congolense (strain IL3000) TaxID=1068625 RepID=G0UU93_TRYCI|nr:unnamed protein product [Trypanosoma congolense IL3000]